MWSAMCSGFNGWYSIEKGVLRKQQDVFNNALCMDVCAKKFPTWLALPPWATHWSLTLSRSSPLLKYLYSLRFKIHFGDKTLQWLQLWLHVWPLRWQELLRSPCSLQSPKQPAISIFDRISTDWIEPYPSARHLNLFQISPKEVLKDQRHPCWNVILKCCSLILFISRHLRQTTRSKIKATTRRSARAISKSIVTS